jgi:hypothetical protein
MGILARVMQETRARMPMLRSTREKCGQAATLSAASAPEVEFLMVAQDPQRQKEHVAQEKLFPTDAGTIQFHVASPPLEGSQGLAPPFILACCGEQTLRLPISNPLLANRQYGCRTKGIKYRVLSVIFPFRLAISRVGHF